MSELASVADRASAATGFARAAAVSEVPSGWVLKTTVRGREIALANRDGTFYALDNSCTHAGGPLGDNRLRAGCILECPWHNARFDIRTGEALQGPARKAVRTYEVLVEDDTVFVRIE